MELDQRYQWLEKRITACLSPKREALQNLIENEDNKLVIMEFLNNEDVKQLYIYTKSHSQMIASRNCSTDGSYEKGIYFLKISNSSKLTAEQMNNQVSYFESSIRIFDHMDLMTREVFMPLLCADSTVNDNADKLMDVMHRIISQLAIAQSQIEDSVSLPLPALSVLATAASNPNRRLNVLHILETTLINWQKQIKNALKQQPEIANTKVNFFTKDEIQLWTSCINKLNNLIVQLDAPHVKDILMNLENNNSAYIQPFNAIKNDIKSSIKSAEINLRYISTLTPWVHKIKLSNLVEDAQYLFTGLFHTLLLIWQHSKYYHLKDRFAHMLLFLSNEIVAVSKEVVGDNILEDPSRSYNKLKDALRICAMFRGTYLDFKEKADALNSKFHKLEKKIDFHEKQLWWVQLYSSEDRQKMTENDEFEVMRQNSPWPKRNHSCFYYLNVFMERCNDVLELVQTMRHFQILSKTVSIGGSDNHNMDILAQEIHAKYVRAINDFQSNVSDVMNFDDETQSFQISFFHLRTTIKELERELSKILNLSIKHCTTIASKLRLLEVFEGVHERDVIQNHLSSEYSWLMNEMLKEFANVKQLCTNASQVQSALPVIVTKLFWYHGLEQRIKIPMEKFSYLYPNLLQGDLGYQLRETYKSTVEYILKHRKEALKEWQQKIGNSLTDKLQQTVLKNVSIEEMLSKRPSAIEVNLDFELEKLLKEIHYLQMPPLNVDLSGILKEKFNQIKDENKLRLFATRIRSISDKYNLIMKNIQPEEVPLFELKLNKIDNIIELGLNDYTWNSVEIPDYIENAHSIICTDVYQNLELTQTNAKEIYTIVNSWCEAESDLFKNRDNSVSHSAKALEQKQIELHTAFKKEIIRGGNKIHTLITLTLQAVGISEASPGWQEYINFTNEIIFNGFKISSLTSLRHMSNAMTHPDELKTPFVCIDLELIDSKLLFNPPLDENSHLKNLQEILFDFINTFISRGSYMQVLGKNRNNYDQMVARDDAIFDIVNKINNSIEKTCGECKKIIDYFNAFSFLWTGDIHETFDQFLRGISSLSRQKQARPPSKNFMSNRNVAKSITSLGSMLTPEVISNIERTFLSPYYQSLPKHEKEQCLTPLLEDFDTEIAVYVNAREEIKKLQSYRDIDWIRVKLQPTIDVLVTLTNKLIWKFTSFLSNQIKTTLNELDQFLKRMEPDIEKITGEERDTATFMKIMRMFNEVSSKQQEMEVKFELMKRTLNLLKKYNRFDVIDLETKFNSTPIRWTNLKSKVTLAKQRLGPTIQEESKIIIEDLKAFSTIINNLLNDIMNSYLFDRGCEHERAFKLLDEFTSRFEGLQNEADDLKQLQELLDSNVVDFNHLVKSKTTLFYLKQTWKTIRDIRMKHSEWKSIRWQKVNIKMANEETDKQLEQLHSLPTEAVAWDVVLGTKHEINNIKNCLPIIEEIANSAMRTRHWKQLVRISGGTALVDNETLKMLTFGQLLDLNLQAHVEEVKNIVQKAVKDLSIEQTIKTYEEIWLSKVFKLRVYGSSRAESSNKTPNDDDDKSSHDRRSSQSRIGMAMAPSTTKSTKRLSIGSLPMSLAGLEPIGDNEPVFLFEDADSLFAELEHHQIVLEELLHNQSAGSFYDEIIKWQNTLQNMEAVLQEWNKAQLKWKRLEPVYSSYEIHTILPQDSVNFFKSDKDFRILMKATHRNNNILKCCQRKNILGILKHLNQNFETCYEALLQEMSKKRAKCPRLYLLNDEDLLEVLCCGSNLDSFSLNISRVFNHVTSLKIDQTYSNDKKIVGLYGRNKEYLPLKTPIVFKGSVEELINDLQSVIPVSLKYLLEVSLNGSLIPTQFINHSNINISLPKSADSKSQVSQTGRSNLAPINEIPVENNEKTVPLSIPSWMFQHCSQIIDVSLRILLTKQVESCLGNLEELKKLEAKTTELIDYFSQNLNSYNFKSGEVVEEKKSSTGPSPTPSRKSFTLTNNSGIILSSEQHDKIDLIVRILVYYRNMTREFITKNTGPKSPEWLRKLKYYYTKANNQTAVIIKTGNSEVSYGFQYYSTILNDECELVYNSDEMESTISYIIQIIKNKSSPLIHGQKAQNIIKSLSNLLGYEYHFLLCSEQTTNDVLVNISKALVFGGYWIGFLDIHNLSSRLMSSLSSTLTQINERKENITINNELYKFVASSHPLFAYFATTSNTHKVLTNSKIDSLKVTKIDHYFSLISKDLFDKFRIVHSDRSQIKSFIETNLVANGFTSGLTLTKELVKLNDLFSSVLKVKMRRNDLSQDIIDPFLLKQIIHEASKIIYNKRPFSNQDIDLQLSQIELERNAISNVLTNAIYPRIDLNSGKMLLNILKLIWPDVSIQYRHEYLLENNVKALNIPVFVEKETAMQIEDKTYLNDVSDAVSVATQKLKFSPSVLFQTKAVNVIEILTTYRNLLLIGKSGCGKTSLLKTSIAALGELGHIIDSQHVYINSYTNDELFGQPHGKSNLAKDGLISNTLRNFHKNSKINMLHIVGESSPDNFYFYESLFNNDFLFLNQNNEKTFNDLNKLKLIWETDDISNLSPSVVSTSNVMYFSSSLTIWEHIIESVFQSYNLDGNSIYKKLKEELSNILTQVKAEFDLRQPLFYKDVLPVTFESKVRLALSIMRSMIKNNDRWEENDIPGITQYCVSSGISASMTIESREAFNTWIKTILKAYPKDGTIYDYFYDIDSHQFQLWSDNIPTFSCPIHQGIPLNIFVHTPSTMFLNSMLDVMMNLDESFLIAGETGCGKTSLISDKLKTSCSGDLTELFYITINTNRLTNSNYLHSRINHHLSWIHGSFYLPKGNKRMYCFIDDIHQANIDDQNRQTAIEFLRQHLDSERFYDFTAKKWQHVKNVTYISTFNYKSYSPSNSVKNKILKHFHVIAQHFPSNPETHGIYTKLLYRHLVGDVENESSNTKQNATILNRLKNLQTVLKNIVQSSIDLNTKMRSIYLEKSQRLHYVFTLRVLTSLFRHMCLSLTPDCTKEQLLLLWHHECDWLYGQRMIDNVDVERYQLAYKTVVKMNFSDQNELAILNRQVYFSNLKETESGIVIAGLNINNNYSNSSANVVTDGYEHTNNLENIRHLIQTAVNEYNKEQQRISLPLYESTLSLICRLSHTTQCVGGNCCIVADGGISPFTLQLVASLMQYSLVQFKTSQFMYSKEMFFQQLKHKLISSYYKAGIRGEKVMLCLTEEEMGHREFLAYITEFLISEEVMHLFTIEEETTILNSIRTQVVQAGLVYTRETAWEFFVKNIRENTRIVIIMNENSKKFQNLGLESPSLFNNMELIWIQHWSIKQLVDNASYHFKDIKWLDGSTKENLAHLLASMHNSIRESDTSMSSHLNNLTFTKFVEKFKELLIKKYHEIESSHKNVCRLLENIQRQHSIAKKLLIQLQQENMVLEERINSTDKMLQQIGQDMTMTEQQLKVHNMQTKKTVQLKRILPEYQSAHERNVYKTVAIVANTKKLIQNINMNSLQELRGIQKPEPKMEDILAAVIMILKSPTADVTWQKGAKRQMANLDRFMEELQSFDDREIAENTIKLLEDLVKKIESYEPKLEINKANCQQHPYLEALNTMEQWIKGVLRYHSLMIKHVKPLHKKVEEIEKEVKEADQKLTTLNRKSEALNARLKDLAQNFEEATVDKEEQEEKVIKMKQQLTTASELNTILAREFDRNMQVYESLQERIFCLPGACALAAGFLVYLGPYQFPFRRLMLTINWVKCLNDRGLPLVLDSLSLIKGRVVKWQMDSLSHLLMYSSDVSVPGEDWKVHFASEHLTNEPFIGHNNTQNSDTAPMVEDQNTNKKESIDNPEKPSIKRSDSVPLNKDRSQSAAKQVKINEPEKGNEQSNSNSSTSNNPNNNYEVNVNQTGQLTNHSQNFFEESTIKIESHGLSALSRTSEHTDFSEYFVTATSYRQFIIALIQYIIGENECMEWMANDASGLELENGAIIAFSERHPPIIYDPFSTGINWIFSKITSLLIDLETRNSEDLLAIEKSFQSGTSLLYSNCTEIDSILLPLIYYKNAMNQTPGPDDSRLVLFSNRRLFCNPSFQMYFQSPLPLNRFSPNTLTCTTPISYESSVENFIDQFQLSLFEALFPTEYKKRNILLNCIKECNEKLSEIDDLLKLKWETDGFQDEEILLTKVALQRKYKIGEILDYCHEYLQSINEVMKILTPLAIRASLLMTLSLKMNSISKNYEFSVNQVEYIFLQLPKLVQPKSQELIIKAELHKDDGNNSDTSIESQTKMIESELPDIPSIDKIVSNEIKIYSTEDIEKLIKYLTNSFLNSIIISLLPEHRLYLLTLICFYIKSEQKTEFTDLELEFLMRGKYTSNISISLTDFGVPKNTPVPNWLPQDNWNDLLAMSLLQGELDHFVVAVVSAEKEWKEWYQNPFNVPMPKIEMEIDKTNKTEMVELNDFRKLVLHKVLRPDSYIVFLNEYVCKSLELVLEEPNWNFVFQNPWVKSIIINMGSKSNISNTSSMSRIHKNLFEIAKHNKQKITALNCNFLTLTELRVETKNIKEGYLLLKNAHLASKDITDFIKSICDNLNNNDQKDVKWRLILTKSFDHEMQLSIVNQCLQVSFDVIDIIAHNSAVNNKKLTLDTCITRPETLIFNCIQGSLNLTKNDEISAQIKNIPSDRLILVYIICLAQGILQSRQNLTCIGLQKWLQWSISSIVQCLVALGQYESNDFTELPGYLIANVYSNFLQDELDKTYLLQLLTTLLSFIKSDKIIINGVTIPIPASNIPPQEYPNWLEIQIPERRIESKILQLHERQIIYYSTILAEDFIENLQQLWETSGSGSVKLTEELEQDWLYYSIKMCNDKLPPKLTLINEKLLDFSPENSIAFALYEEYKLFNENIDLVRYHLQNIEKYLLLNTQLFPKEWKNIALTLQSQRVPDEWEHPSCRPSIHTLKSWINAQNIRYNQLQDLAKTNFSSVKSLKSCILKQPQTFFSSIVLEKCAKNGWNLEECELCFEIKEDGKVDPSKNALILQDLKIIGASWNVSKKQLNISDKLINKLPPVMIYANKIVNNDGKPNPDQQNQIIAYMTPLRQAYVTKMTINNSCKDVIPYIAFDTGEEESQSRRLFRPIMPNLINTFQQSSVVSNMHDSSPSLSAAGISIRQSLSRLNTTLQQIREASTEVTITPESQLSFKPMTPNAPALPSNLQTLSRSRQIEIDDE